LSIDGLHKGIDGSGLSLFRRGEKGFTLVELLVAMAVASVVAMSGFALFSASNWSYQVQESVGEAQQNARIAMDRMARDIRMAGYGLPGYSYSIFGFDSPITVEDSSTGPDKITILGIGYEAGDVVGGTAENRKGFDYICYAKTTTDEMIRNTDGTIADSRKYVNIDGVFFATLKQAETAATCTGGIKLYLDSPSKLKGDLNSGKVYIIQAVEYSIVTNLKGCSVNNPCLASKDYSTLRGSDHQLLAENIEDIQFAYGLDADGDGIDCTTAYTSACFKSPLLATDSESNIRAVRMSLSARTRNKDPKGATFRRPAIENHPESDPPDNYRRRTLTRIVKLRN